MKTEKGFTLVEILIVVVILGILAAIVIPQFTGASIEAKESSLQANLQSLRSQIELFKIQHNEYTPGTAPATKTAATYVQCMTGYTDVYGQVWVSGKKYGKYMERIPENPFNKKDTVEYDGVPGGDSHGWHYLTTSGWIRPDDSMSNPEGTVAHIDY